MRIRIVAVFALLLLPAYTTAQPVTHGDTIVEVVGLRSSTVDALKAEVQRYGPGLTLASSACAVILRDSVGFADAAALVSTFQGSDTTWVLLTVVEPGDSALVRYDTERRSPIPIPEEWVALDGLLAEDRRALSPLQHPEVLLDGVTETFWGPVPEVSLELRERIRAHSTPGDRKQAYEILERSSDPAARELAALIATNFPDDDRTWHLLIRGMIAGSDFGTAAATMVFGALARSGRFSVDWSEAEEELRAVLGGTNLFAYRAVLTGLIDTGMQPEFARQLARQNPNLLVDHAVAENRAASAPALRFLEHAGAPDPKAGREVVLDWIGR